MKKMVVRIVRYHGKYVCMSKFLFLIKLEERLRDVLNDLDLGMEKMLRGAERDSFGLSGLGQVI